MTLFSVLTVFFAAFLITRMTCEQCSPALPLVLCASTGDEDIKIAVGGFKKARSPEDSADDAAQEFLQQKSAGNIEKARSLGLSYAEVLIDISNQPMDSLTQQEIHHRLLLSSYIINRVIADYSPNSILAQTSLSVFYNEVEAKDKILYKHISDTAAFSLYILSERSGNGDDEICKIYARLSGFDGVVEKISQINSFYRGFYEQCVKMIGQTAYDLI